MSLTKQQEEFVNKHLPRKSNNQKLSKKDIKELADKKKQFLFSREILEPLYNKFLKQKNYKIILPTAEDFFKYLLKQK